MNLVTELRAAGHEINLDGEKLTFKANPKVKPEYKAQILATLRARKQEIIAFLVAEDRPTAPPSALSVAQCGSELCNGCYSIGPNVFIHPPKNGAPYVGR